MKLEVGMLLRTKEGIRKIEDVWEDMYDLNRYLHNRYPEGHPLFKEDIEEVVLKASHTLLGNDEEDGVIEVGDYVNGYEVYEILPTDAVLVKIKDYPLICRSEIKSIVTKEQFEQMQYKVGD